MNTTGIVYLVGAGPGNAKLLTLRGLEVLKEADCVVYDALVNKELLQWNQSEAEIIYGGKRANQHAIPQGELNEMLIARAREGKRVVRLKGGDPYLFGRGGEEAEALAAAEVRFEVVPGISSIVAAPTYAGIPLTHRDYCSSVTVITGHEDPTKPDSRLDWAHLAKTSGPLVILMGVENMAAISSALMGHGMAADTPVASVRWGTTGQQKTLEGTLETITDRIHQEGFAAPAMTVIGEVVRLRETLNWYEQLPLFGKRVVVTRTRRQASKLTNRLVTHGAEVMEIPTIRIGPPSRGESLKDAMLELHAYDWIVFTSPNGVRQFFYYFFEMFEDIRDFGGMRIAAIGPATAQELAAYHLKVDLMPEEFVSTKLAEALKGYESLEHLKILLMRAEAANPELPQALEQAGAIVDDVACYRTEIESEDSTGAAARFEEGGADWITFTSSSTVENFHARFGLPEVKQRFPGVSLLSIGPETSKSLRKIGLEPDLEAQPHTIDGMIESLLAHQRGLPSQALSATDSSVAI